MNHPCREEPLVVIDNTPNMLDFVCVGSALLLILACIGYALWTVWDTRPGREDG